MSGKEKLMSTGAINPRESQIPEPNVARLLFADTRLAPVWLVVRVYLGYLWLVAGWEKLVDPSGVWVGGKAGGPWPVSPRGRGSRRRASTRRLRDGTPPS